MIQIPINHTLLISEEQLIREEHLTKESSQDEIARAVYHYICGLDDIYFYSLKEEDKVYIIEKISTFLKTS